MTTELVWLITGTTSGIGRDLVIEALSRGEKVIATGRNKSLSKLDELKRMGADILELDVTSPLETLHDVAKRAVAIYGRVDVVVNNAGYILSGVIEENTPRETYDQFNTNVFGALNVARAFLPYMRQRKSGTIVNIGSVGGYIWAPYNAVYAASKWALRAPASTLATSVPPFLNQVNEVKQGIVPLMTTRNLARKAKLDCRSILKLAYNGKQPGNPKEGVRIIVDLVRGEGSAAGRPFTTNLCLGSDCMTLAKGVLEGTLQRIEEWKDVSLLTDFEK